MTVEDIVEAMTVMTMVVATVDLQDGRLIGVVVTIPLGDHLMVVGQEENDQGPYHTLHMEALIEAMGDVQTGMPGNFGHLVLRSRHRVNGVETMIGSFQFVFLI